MTQNFPGNTKNPGFITWKVAVVADVAVEAVDFECFSLALTFFRFRIRLLWTSTRTRVRQPAKMAALLK